MRPRLRTPWGWIVICSLSAVLAGGVGHRAGSGLAGLASLSLRFQDPLGRLGARLTSDGGADHEAFPPLEADLTAVEATMDAEERALLRLLVALRGLARNGEPDWIEAGQRCRELRFVRCDGAALRRMVQEVTE